MVGSLKFTINNVFLFFLCIWILSMPYKNLFYQFSTMSILFLFLFLVFKNKDYMKVKGIFTIYKDICILFILLILFMFLSTLLNFNNMGQLTDILKYFFRYGGILFILLYFYEKNILKIENLLFIISISFFIVGFNGYFEYFFNYSLSSEEIIKNRIQGGMFNPNTFGFYMSLSSIFFTIIYFTNNTNMKVQIISFMNIPIFLFLTLHSGSRSAWLMYIFFFLIYILEIYTKANKFKIIIIFATLITLILITINLDKNVLNRFIALINLDPSIRDEIWKTMIPYILEKPLFGYGIDSFKHVVNFRIHSAHNSVLEILLYMGIVGFFIFSLIIYKIFREIKLQHLSYFGLALSFILVSNFDHSVFTNKIFLSTLSLFAFFIFYNRLRILKEQK